MFVEIVRKNFYQVHFSNILFYEYQNTYIIYTNAIWSPGGYDMYPFLLTFDPPFWRPPRLAHNQIKEENLTQQSIYLSISPAKYYKRSNIITGTHTALKKQQVLQMCSPPHLHHLICSIFSKHHRNRCRR
jgi:hypothetical protein